MSDTFFDRELSWLSFSERVLEEAEDPSVPLLERLFFCGIFSSNLDEYFRVRVASLRSLLRLGKADSGKLGINPHRLLHDIHRIVVAQQERYGGILGGLMEELRREGIHLVDGAHVPEASRVWLRDHFRNEVLPHLEPVLLESEDGSRPFLRNRRVYLVVELWPDDPEAITSWAPSYALVQVPSPPLDRFVVLPDTEHPTVMFLDDVIRFGLDDLFPEREVGRAYAVKLNRDADLLVDEDDFEGDLVDAIRNSLANRETGVPSRFLYDMRAPYVLVHTLQDGLGLADEDLVLGGRYHNLDDYMGFPRFGREDLSFPPWPELPHPELDDAESLLAAIAERDRVVHLPYQSFDTVVRFVDEAAGDPDVDEIWMTVYRVARDSALLQALLKAARAGKRVTVFMEVKARFDEASNLEWAERMEEAGVRTLYSMPGIKVHAKIALIVRREGDARRLYAYVGTGNFNEKTARIYADHGILTVDERVTQDVEQVFHFLEGRIQRPVLHHLLVAPFTMRDGFNDLIEAEAERARAGEPSGMKLKMNSLEDTKIIRRLYEASRAGVPIELIVRGICRLVPGVPGQSETVRLRSILDRHLEHARIYMFHAGGEERMYLASADWMKRNLSHRVEVAIPVFDPEIRRHLNALMEIQLADNVKARRLDEHLANHRDPPEGELVRSQEAFRDFVARWGKSD